MAKITLPVRVNPYKAGVDSGVGVGVGVDSGGSESESESESPGNSSTPQPCWPPSGMGLPRGVPGEMKVCFKLMSIGADYECVGEMYVGAYINK